MSRWVVRSGFSLTTACVLCAAKVQAVYVGRDLQAGDYPARACCPCHRCFSVGARRRLGCKRRLPGIVLGWKVGFNEVYECARRQVLVMISSNFDTYIGNSVTI